MPMYETKYTVTGRANFPVDMLRKDESYPATEEDANNIMRSWTKLPDAPYVIKLRKNHDRKWELPEVERWRSFGWQVVEGSVSRVKL